MLCKQRGWFCHAYYQEQSAILLNIVKETTKYRCIQPPDNAIQRNPMSLLQEDNNNILTLLMIRWLIKIY